MSPLGLFRAPGPTGPREHIESSIPGESNGKNIPSATASSTFFDGSQTSHPTVALVGDAIPTSQLTFEAWIRPSSTHDASTRNRFIARIAGGSDDDGGGWGVFIAGDGGGVKGSATSPDGDTNAGAVPHREDHTSCPGAVMNTLAFW